MEQPVSGVIASGDPSLHQLFSSWRVDAVTWLTDAATGLWSALPSSLPFAVEKDWPGLSEISKIWGCAMDFLFCCLPFSDKSYHSLFQSYWAGIFKPLVTITSVFFLCMARMISPTYINLCLLTLSFNCGFIAWLLNVMRSSHNYSHSDLDLKTLDNF